MNDPEHMEAVATFVITGLVVAAIAVGVYTWNQSEQRHCVEELHGRVVIVHSAQGGWICDEPPATP